MNIILVAIISGSVSIFSIALSYYLTKRYQLFVDLRNEKINHYKMLLTALSDLAVDGMDKEDANRRFSLAANTIALVAPQYVIEALMAFHGWVRFSNRENQAKSPEEHDKLLKKLLLAIRKDIGLAKGDNSTTFNFHLIGTAPVKKDRN
jgi:hypothetical protein